LLRELNPNVTCKYRAFISCTPLLLTAHNTNGKRLEYSSHCTTLLLSLHCGPSCAIATAPPLSIALFEWRRRERSYWKAQSRAFTFQQVCYENFVRKNLFWNSFHVLRKTHWKTHSKILVPKILFMFKKLMVEILLWKSRFEMYFVCSGAFVLKILF